MSLSQVPSGKDGDVQEFEVEVRGDTYYSKEVRKVLIKVYRPMTFVQTDKPIYLPGQTGNLELMIYDAVYKMVPRCIKTDFHDTKYISI